MTSPDPGQQPDKSGPPPVGPPPPPDIGKEPPGPGMPMKPERTEGKPEEPSEAMLGEGETDPLGGVAPRPGGMMGEG